MTAPTVSRVAERTLEYLHRLEAATDPASDGWLLRGLVAGVVAGNEEMFELVEGAGAGFLLPEAAPADWLELLAALNGARLQAGMTDSRRRL
ncbi:MAG: hypothetical protein QM679_02855, partial [Patulibacter sp.]